MLCHSSYTFLLRDNCAVALMSLVQHGDSYASSATGKFVKQLNQANN